MINPDNNNINLYLYTPNNNFKRSYVPKKTMGDLISPKNYTWKKMFSIMNKIKCIWCMNKFPNFSLEMQNLSKYIYKNLKFCEKPQNLSLKNSIIISDINSFFQTNLYDFLKKKKKSYDYLNKKKFVAKNEENIFFNVFKNNFTDLSNSIKKNKKSLRQLKKLRWYIVLDEDNFFCDEKKSNDFSLDFCKDNNDSFDSIETKNAYDEYIKNDNNKIEDCLDEINEEKDNIINDELINKLLNKEENQFFYIIKLIFLSVKMFCKATVCHLLNSFSNITEEKFEKTEEEGKILINEYLLHFNNFIDACLTINKSCENINIVMNSLYEGFFQNYPKFPRFSIFRMCLRIWFSEINTHLIGQNTLLSKISKILLNIFDNNLKEDLFDKMEENLKNKNNDQSKSLNYNKEKSFGLSTSFMLYNSGNTADNTFSLNSNFTFSHLSTNILSNTYNNSDKIYKILEKGFSIINDTYSNEYSVYSLNLSSIYTNSFYTTMLQTLNNSINNYIRKIFVVYLYENKHEINVIIRCILSYFDNYFFKMKIIPNLKKHIYENVYSELKNNLLEFAKNKYLEELSKNKKKINCSSEKNIIKNSTNNSYNFKMNSHFSTSSNYFGSKSSLATSVIFDDVDNGFFFGEPIENKYDKIKKDIINYITDKNTSLFDSNINTNKINESSYNNEIDEIEKHLEDVNEKIKLFDLFLEVEDWHKNQMNKINENDKKIKNELLLNKKINIPVSFDFFQRRLLSYSLQYNWEFIKKVKNVENYKILNNNNNNIINSNNNINKVGLENNNMEVEIDYFSNLDNIGNIGNANNTDINELGLNNLNNFNNIGNEFSFHNNNIINNNFINNTNNPSNINNIGSEFSLRNSFFK